MPKCFIEKTSMINLLKNITEKNECTTTIVAEACRTVLELNIPKDVLVDAKIQKLTVCVHDVRTELDKVQFELNLNIIELELRA